MQACTRARAPAFKCTDINLHRNYLWLFRLRVRACVREKAREREGGVGGGGGDLASTCAGPMDGAPVVLVIHLYVGTR